MTGYRYISTRTTLVLATMAVLIGLSACGGRNNAFDRDASEDARAEQLYNRSQAAMKSGNFLRSIQILEALEVRFPFSDYARQAQLDLMYAYYRSGNIESAIESANRFIREHPRHEKVEYAYYMRGLANYPEGLGPLEKLFRISPYSRPQEQSKKSFDAFDIFLQRFPDSEWSPDARQRMIYLRNAIARHELEVADYYIRRGAYIAAANRAKRVIEQYQESDAVLDALRIQIRAYRLLGLDDLAQDSQRVLDENLATLN